MSGAQRSRIKKRRDFLKANAANRKFVTPGVIVQARAHDEAETGLGLRLGFTVSKKVGNAVARNRARRRLRAAAAAIVPGNACTGHDLVLIGRIGTLTRPYGQLCNDLTQALKRLKVT